MEALKTLQDVISVLSQEEKASVRSYLKTFVPEGKGETNRGVQLFDQIASNLNRSNSVEEIEHAIYKKSNRPALKRLANRTRVKVLDALILDINVDREGAYSDRIRANIEVRKRLTQAQILQNRGKIKLAKKMFESVVDLSAKFELYEEQMIALRILIRNRSLVEGDKHLPHLMKKYLECERAKNAIVRSEIYFTQITAPKDFQSEMKLDATRLRAMLDEMREDYNNTGSAQIGHYYYELEAQNYQQQGDYTKARRELLNNLKLIKNYPPLQTAAYLFGVTINLADNDLYLGQFDRAYQKASEALQLSRKGSHNYEVCIEIMFYSKFFSRHYDQALKLLSEYIPSEDQSLNFRAGKRSYFIAASYFMLKDFQAASKHLNLINPIDADKDGWGLGIKILQIMNAIELDEFDEATNKIEALRKFFSNGNGASNHRAKLIHTILNSLSHNGYSFKPIYQEQKTFFEMLNKDGELAWQIKSYEVVVFHQWFMSKVTRQEFIQEILSFQVEDEQSHVKH